MRILFITSRFPLPTVKGDKLRSWQIIRKLASEHDVTLLSYIDTSEEVDLLPEVQKVCHTETVPFGKLSGGLRLLRGIFDYRPFQVLLYESPEMKRLAGKYIPHSDIVHLSTLRPAGNLPDDMDCRLVVDFCDAFSLNWLRRAEKARFPSSGLLRSESNRLRKCESSLIERADLSLAVGPIDAKALGDSTRIVPNSVDLDAFHPPAETIERKDIIFTGNLSYSMNIEAATGMANNIFPKILEQCPDTKLRLVGTNPSPAVRALASDNVEITGFVPSVADEIRSARVAVTPLVSGAGLQNKVLEAMGCATPVVSTSIANAGIGAVDGVNILIADDPDKFAALVVKLLSDRDKAAEIGQNGRIFAEENFSWESTRDLLLQLYSELQDKVG